MYNVSQRYRDGMKQDLRERSYIRVNFGIVNQEAQASAVVDWANTSTAQTYSNSDEIFNNGNNDIDYATFEQDFVKVDGSQIFYNNTDVDKYISSAFVTEQRPAKITINLNVEDLQEIKGLTVSFGDLYPTKFDVINVTTGKTVMSVTDNTSSTWISEEVLSGVKSVRFVFYKMKSSPARLRINYILFGLGKTYTNDNIVESSLEESISPINENLPQYDFSVQLDNYPDENGVRYFDVDNPSSTINYLKKGQEIDVYYGYALPTSSDEDEDVTVEDLSEDDDLGGGEIEWVKGGHFYVSEWESNDTTATIKATDIIRDKEDTYDKGVYNSSGVTYYDLCVSVLAEMGITDYELSDVLKKFKTTTPIPKVTHKEALQVIANACGCEVIVDRDGKLIMKVSSSNDSYYTLSSTSNVTKSGTDYISTVSSGAQGTMGSVPTFKYTFSKEVHFTGETIKYYDKIVINSVILQFRDNLPSEIRITSSSGINVVVTENIEANMMVPLGITNKEIGDLTVTFPKMKESNVKLTVKKIKPTDITDFTMDKTDISENVTVNKLNTLQKVVVSFANYTPSITAEEIATSTYDYSIDDKTKITETFTFDEPYTRYYAKLVYHYTNSEGEEVDSEQITSSWAKVTKQNAYSVTIRYSKGDGCGGSNTLRVYGYKLNKTDHTHSITYNDTGDIITWENPLIDNRQQARVMGSFIGQYYLNTMEYSYSTRGNPELDVGDEIYQENTYHSDMITRIINYTVGFNGSFSGSVTARRR